MVIAPVPGADPDRLPALVAEHRPVVEAAVRAGASRPEVVGSLLSVVGPDLPDRLAAALEQALQEERGR